MTNPVLIAPEPADDSVTIAPKNGDACSNSVSGPFHASNSPQPSSASSSKTLTRNSPEVRIFISTFFTIFLAELGDKTQLTTLLMVAGTRSPWVVFLGAGAALVLTTLLGVLLGRWVATKVSPRTLETSAGAMLLLISVLLLWDIVNL